VYSELALKPSVFSGLLKENLSISLLRKYNPKIDPAVDLFISWVVLKI
jgi:hypothetical protein